MKKWLILFSLLIIFSLYGCEDAYRYYPVPFGTLYDLYEVRALPTGVKEKLNLAYFSSLDIKHVEFISENEEVARVNYKEELITLKPGKTTIKAIVYFKKDIPKTIDFGKVYVYDVNDPSFIPIRNQVDLRTLITSNPQGFYYLDSDIDLSEFPWMEPIPYFSGIFINPKNHVIMNLTITSEKSVGLFKEINNAYIDGLILENVQITGKPNSLFTDTIYAGGLVGSATNSLITNIKVTGEVTNGIYVGGIAGGLTNSYLINSSFEGKVSKGEFTGGLVGIFNSLDYDGLIQGKIKNVYSIVELTGGYQGEPSRIGGLAGMIEGGLIENAYTTGTINEEENVLSHPIGHGSNRCFYLKNIYYTFDIPLNYSDSLIGYEDTLYYITIQDLTNGKELKGLESFIYTKGDYPRIKK